MAYETGSASSTNELLDKLCQFVQAHNWTIDYFDDWDGGSNTKCLLIHRNDIFGGFYNYNKTDINYGPFIGTAYYTGPYNASSLPNQQKDLIDILYTNKISAPIKAYHFFVSDSYVHVVLEIISDVFKHFGIGKLDKAGEYDTGVYAYRSYWSYDSHIDNVYSYYHAIPFESCSESLDKPGTIVRADSDSFSPRNVWIKEGDAWAGFRSKNYEDLSETPFRRLIQSAPSSLTGKAILLPCLMAIKRASGKLSMIGSPYDIRWTRIDNVSPGDTFMIENDKWIVFPVIQKNGATGQPNSDSIAFAYKILE